MGEEELKNFIDQFETLTKKPEKYLSTQDDAAEEIKLLTKKLYNFTKVKEFAIKDSDALKELAIADLDEEQIWQQVDIQNNSIHDHLFNKLAYLLSKKENLKFPLKTNSRIKNLSGQVNKKNDDVTGDIEDYEGSDGVGDCSEDHSDEEKKKSITKHTLIQKKTYKPSIVDDEFFKLSEMEEFLEKMENKKNIEDFNAYENNEDDDEDEDEDYINYFIDDPSLTEGDVENQPKYDDFFDQPESAPNTEQKKKNKSENNDMNIKGKKVKFVDEPDSDLSSDNSDFNELPDEENENVSSGEADFTESANNELNLEDGKVDKKNEPTSTFEARQERLKSRINTLENNALKQKPWQMQGEIAGDKRPQNSLLQEYVEFDIAARPPPMLTEKTTMRLEDIILQRIKDKAWDDVVRKIKPVEIEAEYKKTLVLDQEKSKLSLAQIYEQEFLKQVENKATANLIEKPEVEPPEHQEIRIMLKNLFTKLDALSNFHFTPKPVSAEVKIISNLPAITMEEVAPIAISDAALLAPEEVKPKQKGELIGKSERTATDKKRERRKKKLKQKLKYKKLEAKAKQKLEEGKLKSLDTKNLSEKMLQKITKSNNVTTLQETGGKYIRSSSTFFSNLQDKTNSQIKKKNIEFGKSTLKQKVKSKKKGQQKIKSKY